MDWTGCKAVELIPGVDGGFVIQKTDISPEQVLACFEQDGTQYEIAARFRLPLEDVEDVLDFAYMQDWSQVEPSTLLGIAAPSVDWAGCEYVECVPGRMSGVPVVRDSRVAAETILTGMITGETAEELAYQFTLRLSEVRGIFKFAERQLALAKAG